MLDRSPDAKVEGLARRPYTKPVLIKGPVLASITAAPATISGIPSDTFCWVARAAFGATDIRWMIFRGWLLDDAPSWFRRLYLAHGQAVGTWLAGRERGRAIVRALMMPAVMRKLRGS